ncbi:MAG: HD domain-containing protein [Gammaproteobacteria bacterium]|nr:HD domain-containing protein [Gammaproteobacteria bacterium]MDH5650626.1 HD domain-containing protein [Gammaproteobacteria bacterium]
MLYDDCLYGKVEINEPLLLDIMASHAMQRLKGVSQHGVTALLGITPPFSRFDHSVGAMLLVRRLGADLHEQLGALLHDISHTAFSHVIDFVFDDQRGQSYHEEKKEEFVAATDIPAILSRHGLDWQAYMDEEQYSLLEQPSPALCADRLDYFLRDLEFLSLARHDEIQNAVDSLAVVDGRIVVKHVETARWLAYTFIETDRTSWSNFREVGLYQVTAEAIKAARRHGFLDEADLWGSDELLWNKLQSAGHPEIHRWVALISPGTRFTRDEDQPIFTVSTKVRSIDPPVADGNSVMPYSAIDPVFALYRQEYVNSKQGRWPMGIVNAVTVS